MFCRRQILKCDIYKEYFKGLNFAWNCLAWNCLNYVNSVPTSWNTWSRCKFWRSCERNTINLGLSTTFHISISSFDSTSNLHTIPLMWSKFSENWVEVCYLQKLLTPCQNEGTGNIRNLDKNNVKFITCEIIMHFTLPIWPHMIFMKVYWLLWKFLHCL